MANTARFYFTKLTTNTCIPYGSGVCYIRTRRVFGPFSTEMELEDAMKPHVEEQHGNAQCFEVFNYDPLRDS